MIAACTVISPNYLPFARTLAASYLRHHPGHWFFVLLVADMPDVSLFLGERFEAVALAEIGLADLRGEAMKYDILELNTNVKPAFLRYLFQTYGLEQLVYLDPDICVYSPLEPVFAALQAGANAVLTPHLTTPLDDAFEPSEQDHLYNGTYNLGFAAFRKTQETDRLLRWWSERCLSLGFSEGRTGLFVDQKWMNLAPGMFEGVTILRDAGCNMAYWNLHERVLQATEAGLMVGARRRRRCHHKRRCRCGSFTSAGSMWRRRTDFRATPTGLRWHRDPICSLSLRSTARRCGRRRIFDSREFRTASTGCRMERW